MAVQSLKIHAKSKKYQEIVKTMSNIRSFSFSHGENDEKHYLILLRTIEANTNEENTREFTNTNETDPENHKKSSSFITFVLNDSVLKDE